MNRVVLFAFVWMLVALTAAWLIAAIASRRVPRQTAAPVAHSTPAGRRTGADSHLPTASKQLPRIRRATRPPSVYAPLQLPVTLWRFYRVFRHTSPRREAWSLAWTAARTAHRRFSL